MAVFEMNHPLGQDIETVISAFAAGIQDDPEVFGTLADYVKVWYIDPLANEGYNLLRIADWDREKIGWIIAPACPSDKDPNWVFERDGEVSIVKQRIIVKDMLGRHLSLTVANKGRCTTPYYQFDVIDAGVAIRAMIDNEPVQDVGVFESRDYELIANTARRSSALSAIVDLARRF